MDFDVHLSHSQVLREDVEDADEMGQEQDRVGDSGLCVDLHGFVVLLW